MGALGDDDLRRRDAALDASTLAGGEDGALDRLRPAARQEAGGRVGAVQQLRRPADDLRLDLPERREGHRVERVLVQVQARRLLGDVVDRRTAVVDEAERSALRPSDVVAALLPQLGDDLVDRPSPCGQLHRWIIARSPRSAFRRERRPRPGGRRVPRGGWRRRRRGRRARPPSSRRAARGAELRSPRRRRCPASASPSVRRPPRAGCRSPPRMWRPTVAFQRTLRRSCLRVNPRARSVASCSPARRIPLVRAWTIAPTASTPTAAARTQGRPSMRRRLSRPFCGAAGVTVV